MKPTIDVSLEAGGTRVFACALDWPGLCRGGKTDEGALAALVAYGPRYAAAIGPGEGFTPPSSAEDLTLLERLKGGGGTDFGIPSQEAAADRRPVDDGELGRLGRLMNAAWAAFDSAAARAAGHELRKGPRGGGRDLGKIVHHVLEAEEAYLVGIGGATRSAGSAALAVESRMDVVRHVAMETMADRARGVPLPDNPRRTRAIWTVRYFARRSAWHALDHAWEIEDRVEP